MRQPRLEHYFPSNITFKPSGRSFLDLPSSVRKLVYEYAGIGDRIIDLNYTNLKVYPKGAYPETQDCRKLDTESSYGLKKLNVGDHDEVWEFENESDDDMDVYGTPLWDRFYGSHQSLFLTCKKIHQEVETFTYARNIFRVCLGQPLGFTRLLRMSDNALANLKALTIRLDAPKTEVLNSVWANETYWDRDWQNMPPTHIDLSGKRGRLVVKNWNLVLTRLSQLTRPGQLRLRVIFRVETTADAKAIIDSMVRLLPRLKDCGICAERRGQSFWWKDTSKHLRDDCDALRPDPTTADEEIAQLVQQAVRQLTRIPTCADDQASTPFRYLDLPLEIRFAILEYTDLVSPGPVQWRPRSRIIMDYPCCIYRDENGYPMTTGEGDVLCNCNRRGERSVEAEYVFPCCYNCSPGDCSGICYCSPYGALWSTSCECQPIRPALLSVNSQVRQDAIQVYYTCNQILVTPYDSPLLRRLEHNDCWQVWGTRGMPKTELSLYLSSIARNAFQHIRWLEWVLPYSERSYLLPKTKAWFDYLDTILLMEHAMTLPALTFTINMGTAGCDHKTETWMWFEMIVLPFRRLGEAGLKNFFVNLPLHIGRGRREHHERDLERAVMGKGYDSAKRGKPAERMSRLSNHLRNLREGRYQR